MIGIFDKLFWTSAFLFLIMLIIIRSTKNMKLKDSTIALITFPTCFIAVCWFIFGILAIWL